MPPSNILIVTVDYYLSLVLAFCRPMYCIWYLVFGIIIVTDCFYSISCISSLHVRLICAIKYFFVTYLLTSSVIVVIFSLRATILINLNLNLNLNPCSRPADDLKTLSLQLVVKAVPCRGDKVNSMNAADTTEY